MNEWMSHLMCKQSHQIGREVKKVPDQQFLQLPTGIRAKTDSSSETFRTLYSCSAEVSYFKYGINLSTISRYTIKFMAVWQTMGREYTNKTK